VENFQNEDSENKNQKFMVASSVCVVAWMMIGSLWPFLVHFCLLENNNMGTRQGW